MVVVVVVVVDGGRGMREWGYSGVIRSKSLMKLKACKKLFFGFLTDYFHSGIPTIKEKSKIVTHFTWGLASKCPFKIKDPLQQQ